MNEYPAHQSAGIWKRKILVEKKSKKPLVLHDHRDCGSVTMGEEISRADVGGEPGDPIDFTELVENCNPPQPAPDLYHLICHMRPSRQGFPTNPDSREGAGITPLFDVGVVGKRIIALQTTTRASISSAGEVRTDAGNEFAWLPMKNRTAYREVALWLPEFMNLPFETAKTIALAGDRWALHPAIQRDFSHLLDITHPGDPTAPLAFRLLCEAWEAEHVGGVKELSGYAITAPKNPSGWLAPFKRLGSQVATVDEAVALMGDNGFKGKVKAVLEATSDETTKKAVLALLDRTDAPTVAEGGGK